MKNVLNIKFLSLFFIMAIISLSFCCVEIVYASEEYSISPCIYTDEYISWSKLSEEEKNNTLMPVVCDLDATKTNRLQDNVKKSFRLFDNVMLPASYDIRGTGNKATIRNQMNTGTCWAFSAATALEIFAKVSMDIEQVYSSRHIEYSATKYFLDGKINEFGLNRNPGSGGNSAISSSYMINNLGPVLESDVPFENNVDTIDISVIQNKTVQLDVNEIAVGGDFNYGACNSVDIAGMKNAILESGAVVSGVHFTTDDMYYNDTTHALYYNGALDTNHAITVVGWDDNYSRQNFSSSNRPTGNGAWIIQNSWGNDFGDGGYNYVSYYDQRICTYSMAIKDVDTKVEDNAYIYDKQGHNIAVGFTSGQYVFNSSYGLMVFDKGNKKEVLKEIAFGSTGTGTYKVYYTEGDASNKTVDDMTYLGSGTLSDYGYVTHKLDNPIFIDSSVRNFSIAVYWSLEDNSKPLPLSSSSVALYSDIYVERGRSYVSMMGDAWTDAIGVYTSVVSIKAFTDDVNYELKTEVKSVSKTNNDKLNVELNMTTSSVDKNKLNLIVVDDEDNFVDNVNVQYLFDASNNVNGAKLSFDTLLDNGTYYINVYYDNVFIESVEFSVLFGISSDKFKISNTEKTIYVYSPVTVVEFLNSLDGNSGKVLKDGTQYNSGNVGTGMTIDDYVIVLRGDVTGDGLIKVNDVMKISKYTVEGTGLDDKFLKKAADVTNDSLIKVNDVMKISKYTVEGGTL